MKYFFALALTASLILASPMPSRAQPPKPGHKTEALESVEQRLEEEKKRQKALAAQMEALEKELEGTRGESVTVARQVRKSEQRLHTLEGRIRDLETRQAGIEDSMLRDEASISRLVLALQRIRRVPPEALIARPETPLKTAQSAMLMSDIIPVLHRRAESLKVSLAELEAIRAELEEDRAAALKSARELQARQKELESLMKKRQALYARTAEDFRQQEQSVLQIAARARNLQDLVKKLEENRRREEARQVARTAHASIPQQQKTYIPKAGEPLLPVAGTIKTAYNQPDAFGAPSQGIEIEGRAGGLVIAPMGGAVRFAGPFKNYGNLIIIEHESGYHSLIGGLERIDAAVGRNVAAGEPVGILKRPLAGSPPTLYYELRLNGKPVDPARKFSGLS